MTINEKMSEKFDGLAALIGHTPMLEISLLYKGEPRIVYAKAEYYNYSGSIKDRVAAHILRQAYETGAIAEGMPIAEATSGNTGIAFAAIGAYLGNPVTIFMPDWMSKERINLIESFGATIRLVSKAEGGFTGSIALADRMGETEGAFLPHQFSNPENCAAHYATTGKEILAQLAAFGKRPQGFVAGVGTGGTLMGVKDILQETYPDCLAFPLDPAEHFGQLAFVMLHIGIDHRHHGGRRRQEAFDHRGGQALVVEAPHHADRGVHRCDRLGDLPGAIGAVVVGHDERAFELPCAGGVDAEIGRQLHRAADTFGYIHKRSVGKDSRVERGIEIVFI